MKRVVCCGCLTLLCRGESVQFCPECLHQYDIDGAPTGYLGSGFMTIAEYDKCLEKMIAEYGVWPAWPMGGAGSVGKVTLYDEQNGTLLECGGQYGDANVLGWSLSFLQGVRL